MAESFDFVIFGSGFGGSILSMVLRRLGYSVLLLERSRHPRFAIGESSTPFANLLLERLAEKYELPFLKTLSEWGSWQKDLPQIACGLKRGFTFYQHTVGFPLDPSDRRRQLLVAASPNDRVADTHWYRPEFDRFLVERAREVGVAYFDLVELEHCNRSDGWQLRFSSGGACHEVQAAFAIDASGANGPLSKHLAIEDVGFPSLPRTTAVYAHFRDVQQVVDDSFNDGPSPYPQDAAAVHHVFPSGWIWVLRFNNGVTSAGAALRSTAEELQEATPEKTWRKLIEQFPTIARQFARAIPVTAFFRTSPLSFRLARVVGDDWALLPSAAGFVDPLLSTGFALNLLGIDRLATLLAKRVQKPELSSYEKRTLAELDATAELVGALYAKMNSFTDFCAITLLYFVAMSYTETVWRLGKFGRASEFLLNNDPAFFRLRKTLCDEARAGLPIDLPRVAEAVQPWDIAGLADLSRRNHYPVLIADLIGGREKVGATQAELSDLLRKLGLNSSLVGE